jgi:hypothetical protein
MAFRNVTNVKQLSPTSGLDDYQFSSTPESFARFEDQMSEGDTCFYGAKDSSGNWEVGIGTFQSNPSTLVRTTIIASKTDIKISWSSSGERDVVGGLPASVVNNLFNPTFTPGFVVRSGTEGSYNWNQRTITVDPGDHLSVTFGDGIGGNPILNDSIFSNFLRKDIGSSDADRTAEDKILFSKEIELQASKTIISGFNGNEHIIYYDDTPGSEDHILRIVRTGANDYDLHIRKNGAWERLMTVAEPTAPPATFTYLTANKMISGSTRDPEVIISKIEWPTVPDGNTHYRLNAWFSGVLTTSGPTSSHYINAADYPGANFRWQLRMGQNGGTSGHENDLKIWESPFVYAESYLRSDMVLAESQAYPISDLVLKPAAGDVLSWWLQKEEADYWIKVYGGEPSSLSRTGVKYMGDLRFDGDFPGKDDSNFSWIYLSEDPLVSIHSG